MPPFGTFKKIISLAVFLSRHPYSQGTAALWRLATCLLQLLVIINIIFVSIRNQICSKCFDTVGWAVGRESGL